MNKQGFFKAKGTSFVDRSYFEALENHKEDTRLYLVRDYNNHYDPNAISIEAEITFHDGMKKHHVGWVPREISKEMAQLLDQGNVVVSVDDFKVLGGTDDKPNYGLMVYCTLFV